MPASPRTARDQERRDRDEAIEDREQHEGTLRAERRDEDPGSQQRAGDRPERVGRHEASDDGARLSLVAHHAAHRGWKRDTHQDGGRQQDPESADEEEQDETLEVDAQLEAARDAEEPVRELRETPDLVGDGDAEQGLAPREDQDRPPA